MGVGTGLIIPTTPELDHVGLALIILLCPSTGRLVILGSHDQFSHGLQPRKERGRLVACQEVEAHVGEAVHDLKEAKEEEGRIRQAGRVSTTIEKEGGRIRRGGYTTIHGRGGGSDRQGESVLRARQEERGVRSGKRTDGSIGACGRISSRVDEG